MRIVVMVDMEGITGICKREQTMPGDRLFAEAQELLVGDINATVQGLVDAGADDILVYDCHYASFNAPLPPLHPAARYMRGGAANAMSLAQLTEWCDGRFGKQAVAGDANPRPFDIPWLVLDSSLAKKTWDWSPKISLPQVLDEIARHAEQNPNWLEISGS